MNVETHTENYGEIGKLLRAARMEMRLSTDQASRILHIRVRYLEALEEGQLQELPGLTYTRGYLQAYATFLGLDKDEILRRFEELETVLARKGFYFPQVFSKEKTPSRWMVWGGLGVAVGIYLLWAVFLKPPVPGVSVVEKLPPPTPKTHISAEMVRDVACLREPDVLYPPCTMARGADFSLLPAHGHYTSVMDLGVIEPVDDETEPEDEPESN